MMFGAQPRMAGSKFFPTPRVPLVPRERVYGVPPPPPEKPAAHVSLAERRDREIKEAWRAGFKAAEDRFKATRFTAGDLHRICNEVAAKHGFTAADMSSDRRGHKLVLARHEAMWRCFHETKASYPAIGRVFNRDHTTVMHGVRKHEERTARQGGRRE